MKRLFAAIGLLFTLLCAPAFAQQVFVGQYNVTPRTLTDAQKAFIALDVNGNIQVPRPYSTTQTPITAASGNVANAAATATLTGTATTTVYTSGFEMTAAGATAGIAVTCTITGLLNGTKSYTFVYPTGATVSALPLTVEFIPPLPASAVNTPLVFSCPAGGTGNTNATMVAHGYYQ